MGSMSGPASHAELLDALRGLPGLNERGKRPGTFYRGSRPFLHFHGSAADRTADLKQPDGTWLRLPAASAADRAALLAEVGDRLSPA
jgi:hypothetical protein